MVQNLFQQIRFFTLFPALEKRYDHIAASWHDSITRLGYLDAYADLIEAATSRLPARLPPQNLSVLDTGAGSGGFSIALCRSLDAPFRLNLLDISPKMLKIAAKNIEPFGQPIKTICASLNSLKSSNTLYDIILCAHVIEHCADPSTVLRLLHQALTPNGVILFAVSKPHWCTALVQLRWRNRTFRPNSFSNLLNSAGFNNITIVPFQSGPPRFTSCGYVAQK